MLKSVLRSVVLAPVLAAATTVVSLVSASFVSSRNVSGFAVSLLAAATAAALLLRRRRPSGSRSSAGFGAVYLVAGVTLFFGSLFGQVVFQQYATIVAALVGAVFLIVATIGGLRSKKSRPQLIVSLVGLAAAVVICVAFGGRAVVSTTLINSAELYDRSVGQTIRGTWLEIDGTSGYTVRAIANRPATTDRGSLPVIVNVHGGSWVVGNAAEADPSSQDLADDLEAVVVNLDYRLLFDRPLPDQQVEVVDMVHYLADHAPELDIDPKSIFVFGQSAGGHIAAGAAVALAAEDFDLRGAMLYYPFSDFTFELGDTDFREGNDLLIRTFLPGVDLTQPIMSPASAPASTVSKLPPVFLQIGMADAMQDQGERLAEKWDEAGADLTVLRSEGATHGFIAADLTDRAQVLLQKTREQEAHAALKQFFVDTLDRSSAASD